MLQYVTNRLLACVHRNHTEHLSCCCCCHVQAPTPGVEQGRAVSIDIDEAELLNDVEMGGMSHGELVTHIRKVQQELLSKVRSS